MADGDDREENEHNKRDDTPDVQIGNLQISELEETNILEEYMTLDSQLNQLDVCLDSLEARSDDLVSKLKAILQASEMQLESPNTSPEDDGSDDDGTGRASNSDFDASAASAESCTS